MSALCAFILMAAVSGDPSVERVKPPMTPVTKPALVEKPQSPNGLTLYNAGGDVVVLFWSSTTAVTSPSASYR